jgi:hypothetical protein
MLIVHSGGAHREQQIREVGLTAEQREQWVDERADELLDQVAELGADHHRDGELDQVPAHDEILEAAHGPSGSWPRLNYAPAARASATP